MSKPIVAVIGRQNVGKSTFLNRVAGKRLAIVADLPGTTRDRIFSDVTWNGVEFTIVDTGGMEIDPDTTITRGVLEQAYTAIEEADVIIFLVSAQDGVITADVEIADILRQTRKPVFLAANKADNDKLEMDASVFWELGIGEPFPISAHHGRNTADLLDRVVAAIPAESKQDQPQKKTDGVKIAIVGRPNVGKSMLLNSMTGGQRVIVDNTPGTTRDAIDTVIDFEGENVLLIDTAGIRRRGKLGFGVEKFSVLRAMRAVDRADVALLMLDATELLTAQDMHIAGYVQESAKGIILVVNKWDLVPVKDKKEYIDYIRARLKFMPYASILFISAKLGQGTGDIIPMAKDIFAQRKKRLSTAEVNNFLKMAIAAHTPPRSGRKLLKILYCTQAETEPPTFVFFVNDATIMHFSYERYLENRLRETYGFHGTPIRLLFKSRGEA